MVLIVGSCVLIWSILVENVVYMAHNGQVILSCPNYQAFLYKHDSVSTIVNHYEPFSIPNSYQPLSTYQPVSTTMGFSPRPLHLSRKVKTSFSSSLRQRFRRQPLNAQKLRGWAGRWPQALPWSWVISGTAHVRETSDAKTKQFGASFFSITLIWLNICVFSLYLGNQMCFELFLVQPRVSHSYRIIWQDCRTNQKRHVISLVWLSFDDVIGYISLKRQ